jgi:hypothetical protein
VPQRSKDPLLTGHSLCVPYVEIKYTAFAIVKASMETTNLAKNMKHILFVCVFIAAWAIFQLSGGCHFYQ